MEEDMEIPATPTNPNPPSTPTLTATATPSTSTPTATPTNLPSTPSSSSSSKKRKRLTPDERLHHERERAEKRQKLEEERARKEEEKRLKEQERQEKAKAKELERLEKERIKELERVKREEERAKKEEELAKKNEEKRRKEEERIKKEEEKRKQQEEKDRDRQKVEEKKAKQATMFSSFFQKATPTPKVKTLVVEQTASGKRTSESSSSTGDAESDKENSSDVHCSSSKDRMRTEVIIPTDDNEDVQIVLVKKLEVSKFCPFPFQIKSNMAVAPLLRRAPLTQGEREYLEKLMVQGADDQWVNGATTTVDDDKDNSSNMHKCLSDLIQRGKRKELRKYGRTLIVNEEEEEEGDKDVKILMADVIRPSEGYMKFRMKLLQFKENRRPAYWGTWKRQAKNVKPVIPWAKEEDIDYEFDSDDEWDEDELEDGEEIENSDGEEETEDPAEGEPMDEDDEEGWMVPHGYLSDEEGDGEQMDIDVIKTKEKEFFKSLKEQVKMGIPVIQTEKLSDFKMLFPRVLVA